jgi:chromosome segregation protein
MEREFAQIHARLAPLESKFVALSTDQSQLTLDLSAEESQLEALRTQMLEVDKRLAEAQRDVTLQRERVHQVEQRNLISAERVRALKENLVRLGHEQEELHGARARLESLQAELGERSGALRVREQEALEALGAREGDLRAFAVVLDDKKRELQNSNERTIALVQQIAAVTAEQDRRKGQAENLKGRAQHATEENDGYRAEILRLQQAIADLSAEDKTHRRAFAEAEIRCYDAEARRNALKEQIDARTRQEVEARGSIERQRAKVDFLKGLIESREGLSEGVRFLSASDGWKPPRKLTVADAIHAEERYRPALEAALGEAAGLMVVDEERDAERGIALLQQEEKGKATFVALNRVPRLHSHVTLPHFDGVLGWAIDLASFEPEYRPLFRFLLDRVLVVDSPMTAAEVTRAVAGIRCVTLRGEIASGVGIARGGSARQDEGGTIGKRRQIDELTTVITRAEESLLALIEERAALQREHAAVDLKSLTEAVKDIEKEMTAVEMRIAQLEFEKKRADDSIARNAEAIAELTAGAEELQAAVGEAEPDALRLAAEKSEVERTVGAGTLALTGLEEEWDVRSATVSQGRIALVNVRNDLQNVLADIERTENSLQEIAATLERNAREQRLAEDEIAAARAAMETNAGEILQLRSGLEDLEHARTSVEEEAVSVREETHQRELRIKDHRRIHDEALRLAHDTELKVQDLKAKADHLRARALEEFEFTLALKAYPEDEFVDFAALRDEIQGLRDKSRGLGNINFAAYEEYTEEKKRYEFLSTQRKDLLEAEKTLLETIEEINATAQKKFLDTFALIRTNFIETFKSLFDPGDECDLRLEDGVDPLEAGIDIVAKPRGKRPTSIDLLSGGEKTLTAIALLFAIYLVKPSPFCILDEVDAPLDDANIDRFTRILRKFSNNTQFIVVTHNKRTMEAANALYGITMEEEGISKIVTVRFNQESQVASAAVATA